jgi:hypothetical protein
MCGWWWWWCVWVGGWGGRWGGAVRGTIMMSVQVKLRRSAGIAADARQPDTQPAHLLLAPQRKGRVAVLAVQFGHQQLAQVAVRALHAVKAVVQQHPAGRQAGRQAGK